MILLLWTAACDSSSTRARLPTCKAACAHRGENVSWLELRGSSWTVWAAGVKTAALQTNDRAKALAELERLQRYTAKQTGLLPSKTLYLRCDRDQSLGDVQTLLTSPQASSFVALSLGGESLGVVGYTTIGLWDTQRAERDLKQGKAQWFQGWDKVKACGPANPSCPLLLVRPETLTCGELVQGLETIVGQGRSVGLVAK